MQCSKCHSAMESVDFGTDISVARCTGCGGLYCEKETLLQLRTEWLADTVLDTGSVAAGARTNEIRDIPCPRCSTIMDHIQDSEQAHITLDVCPTCEGVFLDAGELTDIKSVTLMDHLRRLMSRLGG